MWTNVLPSSMMWWKLLIVPLKLAKHHHLGWNVLLAWAEFLFPPQRQRTWQINMLSQCVTACWRHPYSEKLCHVNVRFGTNIDKKEKTHCDGRTSASPSTWGRKWRRRAIMTSLPLRSHTTIWQKPHMIRMKESKWRLQGQMHQKKQMMIYVSLSHTHPFLDD